MSRLSVFPNLSLTSNQLTNTQVSFVKKVLLFTKTAGHCSFLQTLLKQPSDLTVGARFLIILGWHWIATRSKDWKLKPHTALLRYNWGGVAHLQQDFSDDGVDIKHGVQIKTRELFTSPDRETHRQQSKDNANTPNIPSCPHDIPEQKSCVQRPFSCAVRLNLLFIAVDLNKKKRGRLIQSLPRLQVNQTLSF